MPDNDIQDRDGVRERLLQLAEDNPIDLDIIEKHGNFPTRKAAQVWASRQTNAGRLKHVGTMKNGQGKKVVNVFCNGWTPKDDNLRHEVVGTRMRLLFPAFNVERGYGLPFQTDLVLKNAGRVFYVEIDCGTMKRPRVHARWREYLKCQNDLLIVAAPIRNSEGRMHTLMEWSQSVGRIAHFTTIERLESHGSHARVWDYLGRRDPMLRRVPLAVPPVIESLGEGTPEVVCPQLVAEA
ncbi:MAG: hypothetical protein ACKVP0_07460 [Pirellulaceae bacterium]